MTAFPAPQELVAFLMQSTASRNGGDRLSLLRWEQQEIPVWLTGSACSTKTQNVLQARICQSIEPFALLTGRKFRFTGFGQPPERETDRPGIRFHFTGDQPPAKAPERIERPGRTELHRHPLRPELHQARIALSLARIQSLSGQEENGRAGKIPRLLQHLPGRRRPGPEPGKAGADILRTLIQRAMMRAMGLISPPPVGIDSLAGGQTFLTLMDRKALQLLYHPGVRPGLSRAALEDLARDLPGAKRGQSSSIGRCVLWQKQ